VDDDEDEDEDDEDEEDDEDFDGSQLLSKYAQLMLMPTRIR
jgi:hypothetical protein